MGTTNSSNETKERAKTLASQIGSNHLDITIDDVVDANLAIFAQVSKLDLNYHTQSCIIITYACFSREL